MVLEPELQLDNKTYPSPLVLRSGTRLYDLITLNVHVSLQLLTI